MTEHRIYRFPHWMSTPYKHIIRRPTIPAPPEEREETIAHDHRLAESLSRSRRLIQEYILCNAFSLFCTFTFDKEKVNDRTNYKDLKKRFSKALNNYRNRYDAGFQYLYIPELHKDGAVHFHGVMTTPKCFLCSPLKIPKKFYRIDGSSYIKMVPNTPHYMDWLYYSQRFGFFSCSWIRDYEACAVYVSKYMTKDLAAWFGRNDQIVMHTKGLNRPELVYVEEGGKLPGGEHKGDFHGDFCATGMRDIYDTAPYYINWDDHWESAEYRPDNAGFTRWGVPPNEQPGQFENIPWTLDMPFHPYHMPGPFDQFEQIDMYVKELTGNE